MDIYPVGPVYYCPGHPSDTISSDALKFYVGFLKVTSKPLEHCEFVDPQGCSWKSPYQTQKGLHYLLIEIFKGQPSQRQEYFCPKCLWTFKAKSLSTYSSTFWSRLNHSNKTNGKKRNHGRSS